MYEIFRYSFDQIDSCALIVNIHPWIVYTVFLAYSYDFAKSTELKEQFIRISSSS